MLVLVWDMLNTASEKTHSCIPHPDLKAGHPVPSLYLLKDNYDEHVSLVFQFVCM